MQEDLFNKLKIICPRCRRLQDRRVEQALVKVEQIFKCNRDFILEGFLICNNDECREQYPIINGVPIVIKDISRWWQSAQNGLNIDNIEARELRGFCHEFSLEQQDSDSKKALLSVYMWAHYGELPSPPEATVDKIDNGKFWQTARDFAIPTKQTKYTFALDLGCSVGCYTFEMARISEIAVGMDIRFDLVSMAAEIQRTGAVRYPRRRRGITYELINRDYSAPQNSLFMVSDALDPPFMAESFDLVTGLNLLDNVRIPLGIAPS